MNNSNPCRRILVPVDGSGTSDRALAEAIRLARLSGGQLRLLHVVDALSVSLTPESLMPANPAFHDMLREGGRVILARALQAARDAGVPADTVLLDALALRVSPLIVDEAAHWGADLIVVGTHGRRGVQRVLLGSDAEQVVRLSPVPVLLVRGSQEVSS